jgi:hypothetical protein
MDDILRLTDDNAKRHSRKARLPINRGVTAERIEKLKKTFQPYWMRGMIPHKNGQEEGLDAADNFTDA